MNKFLNKGQAAVLLSAFVVVGMVFLVPPKALAMNIAKVDGTCAGQPCEFTFIMRNLSAGQWFVPGGDPTGCCSPSTGPHQSPMKWTTRGGEPGGAQVGNEEGFVEYLVGQHREPSTASAAFREEGASGEDGYHAKLFFHNPLFGTNTCSVEITNPNGQLQAPGKGPVTGSCNAGQANPATVYYTLNSEYK